MGIIDFKSLSNKDSWANPDPAIRKKVQDKLVRLSFDEKAEKLEQELKDLIPSLSGVLNQSVLRDARHGEKFDPEQHFSPILVIQNLDYESVFKTSLLFDSLEKAIKSGDRSDCVVVCKFNQNILRSRGVNLVNQALSILSSRVDSNDQRLVGNVRTIKYSAANFIEQYTKRDYHSTSQLTETLLDEFKHILSANDELSQLRAVAAMLRFTGLIKFRSEEFQKKLHQAFGGVGISGEIVERINSIVSNYIDFDKVPTIKSLTVQEEHKVKIRSEFRELQYLIQVEFMDRVDRRSVQRLDRQLNLNLGNDYENLLRSITQFAIERYSEDTRLLDSSIASIEKSYSSIFDKLENIKLQHSHLSGLLNAAKFSSNTIEINPKFLDSNAKNHLLELLQKQPEYSQITLLPEDEILVLSANHVNCPNGRLFRMAVYKWLQDHPLKQIELYEQELNNSILESSKTFFPFLNSFLKENFIG
ncbi:hypothetical protein B1L04_15345 [Microcystis aeruginosa KW]|jgi:hypothetical protein|uniref:Uncharacterized protein n=1 Tax=Microcystis aeruginosa KW TaxID=1960155 RepID=A0A1V4BSH9_MICAE|nr:MULTISPECIES: hypothetical protein [Microcystis]MCA2718404.1 hypothetical protein [Microcystis sp. M169S2]OPF17380.1 hypothetical protein B1L04_15345 [Microcystis aeruginosa KW]